MGLFLSLIFAACSEKKQADGGLGGDDMDGDGIADIDDVFSDNPLFGSLSVSGSSGNELKNQLLVPTDFNLDGKVGVVNGTLAIGWYDQPSIAKPQVNSSTGEIWMYVDKPRLDRECPNRNKTGPEGTPFCGTTQATLKDKIFTDFRFDATIEANQNEAWGILFGNNETGTQGCSFEYAAGFHSWTTWKGGERFPYGAYMLVVNKSYDPDTNTWDRVMPIVRGLESPPADSDKVKIVTVEYVNKIVSAYINDKLLFSIPEDRCPSGYIGLRTWMGTSMKIKSLSVAEKLQPPIE